MIWKGFEKRDLSTLAPAPDWASMLDNDHFVQFYESDPFLVNAVSEYIFRGLSVGVSCMMAATPEHVDAVRETLAGFGIDLAAAEAEGKLVVVDARNTVSQLIADGVPDPALFDAIIGRAVREAYDRSGNLRVFGEMVALLWLDGEYEAAIRIEELWNALKEDRGFSLFCAYPLECFARQGSAERFAKVCATHSKVIPTESYSNLATPEGRARSIAMLQQHNRELKAEVESLRERNQGNGAVAAA